MNFLIATLPIISLISLVLLAKRSVAQSAAISLVVLILSSMYWSLSVATIGASTLRGIFLATEIAAVVFGAVLVFEILERQKLLSNISQRLEYMFPDKLVQTIFVLLGVVLFMEGVAGFGTPATIAIPLLMGIGYKAKQAVILALLADSIPVSFGAVGLPVSFGIKSILDTITGIDAESLLNQTMAYIVFFNTVLMLGLSIVVIQLASTYLNKQRNSILPYIPLLLSVLVITTLVSALSAVYIGPELPSILAGASVMSAMIAGSRMNIFNPYAMKSNLNASSKTPKSARKLVTSLAPYTLLVSLLLLTRLPSLKVGEWLKNADITIDNIFGSSVSYTATPLYSAATILLIVGLFSLLWLSRSYKESKDVVKDTFSTVKWPYISLILVLVFVQIFINSQTDALDSMPLTIANSANSLFGSLWILIAPFIGALGSFLSGSATVSNLIFSGIQYDIAADSGLKASVVLASQSVGASTGNMIALHNVIAALAIAKLSSTEAADVIRFNVKFALGLLMVMSALGYVVA